MENVRKMFAAVVVVGLAAGLAQADPTPDVWLKFEDNLTNSGTATTATITQTNGAGGTHAYINGKLGKAMDLNVTSPGTTKDGDHITVGNYTLADQGTISMWYYVAGSYSYQTVFDNSTNGNYWESWIYSNNTLAARVDWNTGCQYDLDNLSGPNNWYHIAFTWSKDGNNVDQELYIDGTSRASRTESWQDPGTFYLGGGNSGNTDSNGAYDEVRIYDEVLTGTQINSLIPEPGTLCLLGVGGLLTLVRRRRR